jgi:hypothetical protein
LASADHPQTPLLHVTTATRESTARSTERRWASIVPREIYLTDEVNVWLDRLVMADSTATDGRSTRSRPLAEGGPNLGRPLVDRIKCS